MSGPSPSPDDRGLPAETDFECGVCWTVYDPGLGDPFAQIRPGTPFAALPADWYCPNCDAPKARFMAVSE